MAHPNTIRGPIEEQYNTLREGITETYQSALQDLEETYRSDLAVNRAAKSAALAAVGLDREGNEPATFPETAEPENTAVPTITGTVGVGHLLTAHAGTWLHAPSFSYQWEQASASRSNRVEIAGATGTTYTPVSGDSGKLLRVVVTATNPEGSVVIHSAWSSAVAAS